MDKIKQRIAIALACGWKRDKREFGQDPCKFFIDGWITGFPYSQQMFFRNSPDFLNDLNAMHEAERILTHSQYRKYAEILYFMAYGVERKRPKIIGASRAVLSATAAQRAEAFLKTLGLWETS